MDNFEILGVSKNSSLEEIRFAYENKIKDIDKQVTNEKNAASFKKVLKDAYDGIISNSSGLRERGQASDSTTVMSKEEIEDLLDYTENEPEEGYYEYYEEKKVRRKPKKKRRLSSNTSSKKKSKDDDNKKNYKNKRRKNDKEKEHNKHPHKEESSGILSILLIPFKIMVIPVIILLSVIILILDLISVAVWIVSKVLLVASIAAASIYGYQVYIGSANMRYDLFAACGAAFIIALLLPLIVKIFRSPLKMTNDSLKDFVF